jgi:hypothetical protein
VAAASRFTLCLCEAERGAFSRKCRMGMLAVIAKATFRFAESLPPSIPGHVAAKAPTQKYFTACSHPRVCRSVSDDTDGSRPRRVAIIALT